MRSSEGWVDAIGADAARILRDRGVDVRLGADADEIGEHSVTVGGIDDRGPSRVGRRLHRPCGKTSVLRSTRRRGASTSTSTCGYAGWQRTFAAGDVASHRDRSGAELAMSAQVAVQAGDVAGRNALRLLRGDPLDRARLSHRGWVLDLSGCRGLAEVGPVTLSAPFLDLVPPVLHWAIDVKHLVETRGLGGLSDLPG